MIPDISFSSLKILSFMGAHLRSQRQSRTRMAGCILNEQSLKICVSRLRPIVAAVILQTHCRECHFVLWPRQLHGGYVYRKMEVQ